jgi:hypothetical protein
MFVLVVSPFLLLAHKLSLISFSTIDLLKAKNYKGFKPLYPENFQMKKNCNQNVAIMKKNKIHLKLFLFKKSPNPRPKKNK